MKVLVDVEDEDTTFIRIARGGSLGVRVFGADDQDGVNYEDLSMSTHTVELIIPREVAQELYARLRQEDY